MVRTWTLDETLTLRTGHVVPTEGHIGVGDGIIYFYVTSGQGVYSWNGTTTTDLDPDDFFLDEGLRIVDIAVFNSSCYVVAGETTGGGNAHVYRWTGSAWSLVFDVVDGSSNPGQVGNPPSAFEAFMDADEDNLLVLAPSTTFQMGLYISANGSTFTQMTGSPSEIQDGLSGGAMKGLSKHCSYPTLLDDTDNSAYGCVTYSGTVMSRIDGTQESARFYDLCGYSDYVGKMWGRKSAINGTIVWSDDFTTFTDTTISGSSSGIAGFIVREIEPTTAIMGCFRNNNQVYVWNDTTDTFDTDGTTGSDTVKAFFRLGNSLYALCVGAAGTALIYKSNDTLPAAVTYGFSHSTTGIPGSIKI